MDIGFVGLGTMGRGIVRNLLRAGHGVTVWNRSRPELPQELAAAKAGGIDRRRRRRQVACLCVRYRPRRAARGARRS